jgi:hypothetical protein
LDTSLPAAKKGRFGRKIGPRRIFPASFVDPENSAKLHLLDTHRDNSR